VNLEQRNLLEDSNARIALAMQEHLLSTRGQVSKQSVQQASSVLAGAHIEMLVTGADEQFDKLVASPADGTSGFMLREMDIFEASLAFISIVRRLLADEYSSRQGVDAVASLDDALEEAEARAIKIACRFLDLAAAKNAPAH
jgi:hypothetical protein